MAKRFLRVYVLLCAFLLVTATALAVWQAKVTSTGNILGTQEVKLVFSENGTDWSETPPVLWDNPNFSEDGLVQKTLWFKSDGASPANHQICWGAEGSITQGTNEQGTVEGDLITKYISIEKFEDSLANDMRPTIQDIDTDGQKTLEDLSLADPASPEHCFDLSGFEPQEYTLGFQFLQSAKNVDDLQGDSWDGSLYWILK